MKNLSDSKFSGEDLEAVTTWKLPEIENHQSDELGSYPNAVLTADEIESIQKQAYEEAFQQGREEGLKTGLQEGQAEIALHLAQFRGLVDSFDDPLSQLDSKVEEELVSLAMLVARQLVRRELKIDPGQVIAVVRDAMSILPVSSQKVSLRLHPEDAELVRSAFALEDTDLAWKISEDPLLTRGGCEVVTETSRIDATIEKRLAAVIATALGGERETDEP
ncbi:MAG: flagellar assembly protein FliH [Gammaproteobacteria bacterium]|nr:MAG: flagellar assembly protein FliH [Gammaproteobacteria bacterium]